MSNNHHFDDVDRAGEESVVSRGKAFRQSPYWVTSEDVSVQVLSHAHTSVLELAQRMYEEKVFFRDHVPQDLTQRPRDDKAHAIRCMLRKLREMDLCPTPAATAAFSSAPHPSLVGGSHGSSVTTESNEEHTDSSQQLFHTSSSSLSSTAIANGHSLSFMPHHPLGPPPPPPTPPRQQQQQMFTRHVSHKRVEAETGEVVMDFELSDDPNSAQSLEDAMEAEEVDGCLATDDIGEEDEEEEMVEVFGKVASRAYFKHWTCTLPPSLLSIYEEESRRLDQLDASPPPLGTLPLRELVRTMHCKDGVIIKFL